MHLMKERCWQDRLIVLAPARAMQNLSLLFRIVIQRCKEYEQGFEKAISAVKKAKSIINISDATKSLFQIARLVGSRASSAWMCEPRPGTD